jgi:Xaa-Pro aminopeptidase
MNYFAQRRNQLLRDLKTDNVDAYLLTHGTNVSYLTGFTGDSSYLIVTAKNAILISDSRFEQQITEECPGLEAHIRPHNKTTPEAAVEVLAKANAKAVGLETSHVTLELFEFLKDKAAKVAFTPCPARTEALRVIKDPSELEEIRKAIAIAERAFRMFTSTLRPSDTEKDMVDAIEGYVRRAGGKTTSFAPIVAVGERGALPHAPPTGRVLADGSKVLVDWGADIGYKSDITRTLKNPFPSTPTRKTKFERIGYKFDDIYKVVLEAHLAAVAELRDGVNAKDVDAAARKVIGEAGYGEYFNHGLGHGIGLDIHEAPRIRMNSDDVLQAGMVVTIEPGIYFGAVNEGKHPHDGWGGIRLEDDYLITKDGAIRLTTMPHDPNAIG